MFFFLACICFIFPFSFFFKPHKVTTSSIEVKFSSISFLIHSSVKLCLSFYTFRSLSWWLVQMDLSKILPSSQGNSSCLSLERCKSEPINSDYKILPSSQANSCKLEAEVNKIFSTLYSTMMMMVLFIALFYCLMIELSRILAWQLFPLQSWRQAFAISSHGWILRDGQGSFIATKGIACRGSFEPKVA